MPTFACIGEHPAPLPRGRGAACVNWALLTGETEWGDSFFRMMSEYDKGELYAQARFDIRQDDTVFTVYEKVAMAARKIVRENLDDWTAGQFTATAQDDSQATHYKRRRPTDGEIFSFDQNARVIHNFVRAQTNPYPGAYVTLSGSKIKLLLSRIYEGDREAMEPGIIWGVTRNGGMLVSCQGRDTIELVRVMEGSLPEEWACDWAVRRQMLHQPLILRASYGDQMPRPPCKGKAR